MSTDKRFLENMAERIVDIAGLDIYDSRLNHLEQEVTKLKAIIECLRITNVVNTDDGIIKVHSSLYLPTLGEQFLPTTDATMYCEECDVLYDKDYEHDCDSYDALI